MAEQGLGGMRVLIDEKDGKRCMCVFVFCFFVLQGNLASKGNGLTSRKERKKKVITLKKRKGWGE